MTRAIAKLLTLIAVLLMRFGMAVPAAAAAAHHPVRASALPMQHCPGQGTADHATGGECTMACAATLPAVGATAQPIILRASAPAPRALAEPLLGLHPETATPPPRLS